MELKGIDEIAMRVNSIIAEHLSGNENVRGLYDSSMHLFKAGGKRIRPFILVKSAELLGGSQEDALRFGAAVELLHTFTLVHDDIMDMSEMRRGIPSVHAAFDVPTAIIAGDLLFSTVFEIATLETVERNVAKEVVSELSRATRRICEGQYLDMSLQGNLESDESRYYEMIEKKTAALFEASATVGGIIGRGSPEQIEHLREYGRDVGLAFQLIDDVLGVVGDPSETGKPSGDDLRSGKFTAIVTHFRRNASKEKLCEFAKVFNNPAASEHDIKRSVDLLMETGAIDHAREMANAYTQRCLLALTKLPRNEANLALEALAESMSKRRT